MKMALSEFVLRKKGIYGILHVIILLLSLFLVISISIDTFKGIPFYEQSAPDGTMNYAPWALFAILMVVAILSLVTIFLYRKRMLQIRLTLFSSIILVGYYVTLAAFVWGTLKECGSFTPSWTLCLPLISIILNWLAIRAIGKDEMLVKAYERLR